MNAATSEEPEATPVSGDRVVAVLEGLGAVLCIYSVLATFETDGLSLDDALYGFTPLGIFAGVTWQAVRLWLRRPGALTAMQWILAAQIPWVNFHSVKFHYDVALLGAIIVRAGGGERLEIVLGSRFELSSQTIDVAYFGINLVAAYLFAHLTWSRLRA